MNDKEVNYEIKMMKRKDVILKVNAYKLFVIVPKTKTIDMHAYLMKHKKWILNRINQKGTFILGGYILYLGLKVPLEVVIVSERKNAKLQLVNEKFVLYSHSESDYTLKKIIDEWFKEETYHLIIERIQQFKEKISVDPQNIVIESLFYRWASCSNLGNMKFHPKCAMLPPHIIDYVVVHELCHLLYFDHSGNYWLQVEKIMPDYREKKTWLDEHGMRIIR
ncbi:MAG: M48 family metallopeptidase [Eubacteriales bacterium]